MNTSPPAPVFDIYIHPVTLNVWNILRVIFMCWWFTEAAPSPRLTPKVNFQKWWSRYFLYGYFCLYKEQLCELMQLPSLTLIWLFSSLLIACLTWTSQRALRAYVVTCQSVLRAYVLKCQRVLHAYMLTCLACSRSHVITCFKCLRVNVSCVLMCSRAIT